MKILLYRTTALRDGRIARWLRARCERLRASRPRNSALHGQPSDAASVHRDTLHLSPRKSDLFSHARQPDERRECVPPERGVIVFGNVEPVLGAHVDE